MKMKAWFLDRDGVINELVYHQEHGIIDSPFTVEQFRLLPGVGKAIKKLRDTGYKVVIVSNQPGIAKEHMTEKTFDEISQKMKEELAKHGTCVDGEYYCFHHPEAKVERLKIDCSCRKPRPGLLLRAAKELNIDLSRSWMIGDGLTDIKVGKEVGCSTILLGKMKCELCRLMDSDDARPDVIVSSLEEAAQHILERGE